MILGLSLNPAIPKLSEIFDIKNDAYKQILSA